jgi:hypothetical protein
MSTPDTPELSAIPAEAELYDRLLDTITTIRDNYPRLAKDAPSDEIAEAVMAVFAGHLRAQVEHFTRLAAGFPQTPSGQAAGNAYKAAALHLRTRADELAGGA